MSSANRRAALGALDRVRPVVSGLHRTRPNDELAADVGRAWELTEVVLRALLGGSSLSGQALVKEVRQRELLTLEQAHALVNFQGACARASLPGHQVAAADVSAARDAVSALDQALGGTVTAAPTFETTIGPPPARPPRAAGAPLVADAPASSRGLPSGLVMILLALVLVLLPLAGWFVYQNRGGTGAVTAAEQLYAQGRRDEARLAFAEVARDRPELALPHIYLARIARESGEIAIAQQELQTAIRLEPSNALAQREMGSLLLNTGNPELARRFYTRAVELDPNDRVAQGYLGCALVRLGNADVGRRFIDRAGPGDWSACAQQAPSAAAPALP